MGILFVNHISSSEITYAFTVCVMSVLFALVVDWISWYRKIEMLRKLTDKEIDVSHVEQIFKEMTGVSEIEKEYQEVITNVLTQQVEMQNRSKQKQRDMQDYYGMWVHQIKTPIAALRLLLQSKEIESNEEQSELFLIEQYVDMALQYVRIDSDNTDFVFENTRLEPVIRASIRKYAKQFIAKKISMDFEATDIEAVTDVKWLGFVIDQLLSNAIKYTSNGKVEIRVAKVDDRAKITIRDTGIGIRAEDLPRICEKGYTGYNGHANQHSTGIGLYLCKQIISKLQAKLEISSVEGEGTTVEIIL